MKVSELIEYLSGYEKDTDVAFIAADPRKRVFFKTRDFCITDLDLPVLCVEIQDEDPFDEVRHSMRWNANTVTQP